MILRPTPIAFLHASVYNMPRQPPLPIRFSAHASRRMEQRGVTEQQVLAVLRGGHRDPDAAPRAGEPRWRHTGSVEGRMLTVIVAEGADALVVVTVFWRD